MEYQEFKQKLLEELKEVFPKEQGYEVLEQTDQGLNFLKVRNPGKELEAAMPISSLYQMAGLQGNDLHSIAELMQETVQGAEQVLDTAEQIRSIDIKSYGAVRNHLRLELLRSEKNGAFLANGIYEKQAFGALVPFVSVPSAQGEIRVQVTSDLMEAYGITQREMMKQAMENTQAAKPLQILTYRESGVLFHAITNHGSRGGATAILYPGVLEELHKTIGSDYYVIPLSVQGVLAIGKKEEVTTERLRRTLLAENRNYPKDWLSSKVCEYNGEEKKLSVCKAEKVRKQER